MAYPGGLRTPKNSHRVSLHGCTDKVFGFTRFSPGSLNAINRSAAQVNRKCGWGSRSLNLPSAVARPRPLATGVGKTALNLPQQVTNPPLLAIAAIVAFLCGCWWNAQANRKAKEPFAPAISSADYCAIFLWILAVILGGVAIVSR